MGTWGVGLLVLAGLLVLGASVMVAFGALQAQRRAESALSGERRAREETQQALKTRTAMLGMVSHELRTPLSKILAATELIEMVAEGAAVKEATAELYAAAEKMTHQLNDLSAYSQLSYLGPDKGTPELDVRATLGQIARTLEMLAREHHDELRIEVASDVPYRMALDPVRIEQIAMNLIGNAVKYTREGVVRVSVRMEQDPRTLEFVVADNGMGIAPEEQALIWEPYYRAQNGEVPGTGLGLAIVRLAVTKLGGTVALTSSPGAGSTFTVRLPWPA